MKFFTKKSRLPGDVIRMPNGFVLPSGVSFELTQGDELLKLVSSCAPLAAMMKLLISPLEAIQLNIRDKKTGQYIYEHEALNLIQKPNDEDDRSLLFKSLVYSYVLAGETYLITSPLTISGGISETRAVEKNKVSVELDRETGFPKSYSYGSGSKKIEFKKDDEGRFVDSVGRMIFSMRDWNLKFGDGQGQGATSLAAAYLEIRQYMEAGKHNLSLLLRGGRPTGVMILKNSDGMSKEQIDEIKKSIEEKMQGAMNAGSIPLLTGEFEWKETSVSLKDMDFKDMREKAKQAISSVGGVPLPLISMEAATFSNYETASLALYELAVLPILEKILALFNKAILPFYKGTENQEISFDENTVPVLWKEKVRQAESLAKLQSFTRNEIREFLKYKPMDTFEGGEIVGVGGGGFTPAG